MTYLSLKVSHTVLPTFIKKCKAKQCFYMFYRHLFYSHEKTCHKHAQKHYKICTNVHGQRFECPILCHKSIFFI